MIAKFKKRVVLLLLPSTRETEPSLGRRRHFWAAAGIHHLFLYCLLENRPKSITSKNRKKSKHNMTLYGFSPNDFKTICFHRIWVI